VVSDPHEQHDLADAEPKLVRLAASKLEQWQAAALQRNPSGRDPLQTVLAEGGPFHTRGRLAAYLERLRATDRAKLAERLASAHAGELTA
jgi:hypothetical protein